MEKRITLNQLIERLNGFAETYGNWEVAALGAAGVNDELIHLINLEKVNESGCVERENLGISYNAQDIFNYNHGIKSISLLSLDEFRLYESFIPKVDDSWFLKDPGDNPYFVCEIDEKSKIHTTCYHSCQLVGTRPALILKRSFYEAIDIENINMFKAGAKINVGNYKFTILNVDENNILALCDEIIGHRRFDPDTNEWNKSELKRWLETEGVQKIIK